MAEEDILYGKKRHLFGGIEPQNVTDLELNLISDSYNPYIVKLSGNLHDTEIDGQLICSVDGVEIRKGYTEYPKTEFEGVPLENISFHNVDSNPSSYRFLKNDKNIDPNATYYYSIFPYSKQGVYNRNAANRIAFNEPKPLESFTAKSIYDENTRTSSVKLDCVLPQGVKGAVIARRLYNWPSDLVLRDEYEDEYTTIIADISSSTTVYDHDVELGKTYYYRAFPYTENDGGKVYCYTYGGSGYINVASAVVRMAEYVFGYDLDTEDSNPNTRVTYKCSLDKVDNENYTPSGMNYDTDLFDYGSWPSKAGEKFMPRPCVLNYDGTISYYLDPDDYTKTVDGQPSNINSSNCPGNAMMEWPKIWTKRWEDENGVYHFRCSDIQIDDEYECLCNYDKNGKRIDHFYTAIYDSSYVGTQSRSVSGLVPMTSVNLSTSISRATENGGDWCISVLTDHLLIQDLLVMMAKTTDCQEAYGYGVYGETARVAGAQGTLNDKGMFYGIDVDTSATYSSVPVKVFGMENYWGCLQQQLAGWMYKNIDNKYTQRIKLVGEYNLTATDYTTLDNSSFNAEQRYGTCDGYICKMRCEHYGRLPGSMASGTSGTTTGTSSTYECDYIKSHNDSSGTVRYAVVGGGYIQTNSYASGPFAVDFKLVTYTSDCITSRLSCKPSKTTE